MWTSDPFIERYKKCIEWLKSHPILSVAIALAVYVSVELLLLPFNAIVALRTKNPVTTAFMNEHAEKAKMEGRAFNKRQEWVALKEIPKDLINAVIVSEDGTFWSHHGFDWYEFKESVERNIEEGRSARGASTITQQLVKNLFLSSSKNPIRKMREWILTWWMERTLSKSRMLELYLNVIEFGDAVYGVEAASRLYFGKSVGLISRVEAARLAAIIPSPRRHRADSDQPYVLKRTDLVLERMTARGL
jgi:monofunctional biosynthetic peptidoglycan transglycosylase